MQSAFTPTLLDRLFLFSLSVSEKFDRTCTDKLPTEERRKVIWRCLCIITSIVMMIMFLSFAISF